MAYTNTANFRSVSDRYAQVADVAHFKAMTVPCLFVSSNKNAKTKGRTIKPTINIVTRSALESEEAAPQTKSKPIIEPMVVPHVARLEYSWSFFTSLTSSFETIMLAMANAVMIPKVLHSIGMSRHRIARSVAITTAIGPGTLLMKHPRKPKHKHRATKAHVP